MRSILLCCLLTLAPCLATAPACESWDVFVHAPRDDAKLWDVRAGGAQRQREIASLGGRAAHQSGHAHEFTSEEARAAGRKRHALVRLGG